MAYLTVAQLRTFIGEKELLRVADKDGDRVLDSEELAAVEAAIDSASSDMDSRIGGKYTVPLSDSAVTDIMRRHVARMAVFHLTDNTASVTKDIKARYEEAKAWAKEVKCGDVQLGVTAGEPPLRLPAAQVTEPSAASLPMRTFSISNMRGIG